MRDAWRRFLRHRLAVLGLGVIAILVVLAVGARVFSPHDPLRQDLPRALAGRPPTSRWAPTSSAAASSRAFSTARACRCSSASSPRASGRSAGILSGLLAGYFPRVESVRDADDGRAAARSRASCSPSPSSRRWAEPAERHDRGGRPLHPELCAAHPLHGAGASRSSSSCRAPRPSAPGIRASSFATSCPRRLAAARLLRRCRPRPAILLAAILSSPGARRPVHSSPSAAARRLGKELGARRRARTRSSSALVWRLPGGDVSLRSSPGPRDLRRRDGLQTVSATACATRSTRAAARRSSDALAASRSCRALGGPLTSAPPRAAPAPAFVARSMGISPRIGSYVASMHALATAHRCSGRDPVVSWGSASSRRRPALANDGRPTGARS